MGDIGRTIVTEPVVVTDVERVQFKLDAQAEQFFLAVRRLFWSMHCVAVLTKLW